MSIKIRDATISDSDAMLALLPRLAAFDIPAHREAEHLWAGDAALLREWLAGDAPQCLVQVAVSADRIVGMTLTTLRPDMLSHEPSAHLEVIVVAADAEGSGAGKALLAEAEQNARRHGAGAMTLHVIESNSRARAIYEHCGYAPELLRYIKEL
ncbi:MAG: GNAT family N-acetyltransferase [Woeseia sp.]